ncbi:glutamate-5-semialdehyde dehydrogenase [Legionella septentrionalis]|uniref:glutamate-5-semialdehyde dehydrogenase n=1 Tax=Legionella septentrionalis TaxID=2498109 RepID=UPI000F8C4EBA|nr:glutamate-5-semialdehyde dehydrogenase [Legionella septentrionalis]RUQ99354.1 glutamate-5-semialdehyde dehydrogenase [Legionella septentrionalis]
MDEVLRRLTQIKAESHCLSLMPAEIRQKILLDLAKTLREESITIISENQKDLLLMQEDDPRHDRLLLSQERIDSIANDVESVASLPNPLGGILENKKLPNGLVLQKVPVPLGVVSVIYESRPNVTVDVFALCFKTGNACVLKGGKEAYHSNACLVSLIHNVLKKHSVSPLAIYLLPAEREALHVLLKAVHLVDVCIPRGGQSLINFVREHARIPVIETGAGIVHTYFDASGDLEKGRLIVHNAKTRRVSVCNALDTLIIHQGRLSSLPALVELLAAKQVELYADETSHQALLGSYPQALLQHAQKEDFGREFLSYKMAIKAVPSLERAVRHIQQYTSGHSEAIIAEDKSAIAYFTQQVDAAAVYVNASTAFTDGGQFGLGAEIGISTQKLHARGPMALEALTSYKWLVFGEGQIRS